MEGNSRLEYKSNDWITGTHVSYYFICKTKLWLFAHNISLESESPLVQLGREIHSSTYPRYKRTRGSRTIAPDFAEKRDVLYIHDIKKSSKMREAHRAQMLFYLSNLKDNGVRAVGVLDYPTERRREFVELDSEGKNLLQQVIPDVMKIISRDSPPPPIRKRICLKCAYCEFCWGDELEG